MSSVPSENPDWFRRWVDEKRKYSRPRVILCPILTPRTTLTSGPPRLPAPSWLPHHPNSRNILTSATSWFPHHPDFCTILTFYFPSLKVTTSEWSLTSQSSYCSLHLVLSSLSSFHLHLLPVLAASHVAVASCLRKSSVMGKGCILAHSSKVKSTHGQGGLTLTVTPHHLTTQRTETKTAESGAKI